MSRELWADIEGFDGYQISNLGGIRTNVPPCGRGRSKKKYPWRCVGTYLKKRCLQVRLRELLLEGTKSRYLKVSTLLWKAFIGKTIPKGYTIDHIDRNPLNNKIENLRLASKQQQAANRDKISHFGGKAPVSTYKGVSFDKFKYRPKPWRSTVIFNDKQIFLGTFKTEKEAGLAYDKKALELFGDYAKLNFS